VTNPADACTAALISSAPDPYVGVDEIVTMLMKICRHRVMELTFRDDFPAPAAELAAGAVWSREEVDAWITEHGDVLFDLLKQT